MVSEGSRIRRGEGLPVEAGNLCGGIFFFYKKHSIRDEQWQDMKDSRCFQFPRSAVPTA